jgi:AraC-like DNA-binding protein
MHVVTRLTASETGDMDSASLSDHVWLRLMETIGDGDASLGGVARGLRMSVAALQRGLREDGTSFTRLLGDVRRRLTIPGAHAGAPPLDEIALAFGFPDPRGTYWILHRPGGDHVPVAPRSTPRR